MNKKIISLISFFLLIPSDLISQTYVPNPESLILIRSNLEYLASDELEGREATTQGEELAAEFISKKLLEYGILPFGDGGTYYQNFNVDVKGVDSSSIIEFISVDNSKSELNVGDDFYLSTAILPSEKYNDIVNEIVFARFGITAADYNYDDYENLDVGGKVVLIYRDTPMQDGEKIFSEEDNKKYKEPKYKIKIAAEHGAAGVLIIPGKFATDYWDWIKKGALSPTFNLMDNLIEFDKSIPSALLSVEAVTALLDKERFSYEDLIEVLEDEEIPKWFLLSKKIKFSYNVYREKRSSKNIIGVINGTSDELKNEFVTIGAHYDHEGIVKGEIYNGADDNGSGVVAILEAARRLAALNKNSRSILIIFHAAEEKGLLGSKYLTDNSSFMENIVVNINVDMVGREHIDTIYSVGSDKLSEELKEIVEKANEGTVNFNFNYQFDEPDDPQRIYYRSDHYNYAKKGIPIVFFYDYMLEDYHKPTDDSDKINFKKIEKISTLITEIALKVANLEHRLAVDIEKVVEESE
jgi:hypothetical protein